MKKLTGILMTLILTLSLAACGSNDPASVYASAAKKYHKAEGAAMILTQKMTLNDGTVTLSSGINGSMKVNMAEGEVTKAAMEGSMDIDMGTGTPMTVPISYYFTEGTLYANMAGTQYKAAMNWAAAADQMGPAVLMLMYLEKEDFQEITMKEEEEQKVLSFIISADKIEKITGAVSQWNQYEAIYGGEGNISFQSAKGSIIVKDKYPVSEQLVLTGTVTAGGKTVTVTNEINIQVTTYEDVEVSFPDFSSYQQITNP